MSLPNAANGINGVDTNCGHPALQAPMANGGGFDYVEIPDGQCDSPVGAALATTETNDRYCGAEFRCLKSIPAVGLVGNAGKPYHH